MLRLALCLFLAVVVTAPASAQHADRSAAEALGLTGPVTVEQAAAIAAQHADGPARFLEEETENGVLLYGFAVDSPKGLLEVEVRQSDGAVLEVEEADDEGEDEDDEGADDDGTGDTDDGLR